MNTETGLLNVWYDDSSQVTLENEFGERIPYAPCYFYYGVYVMEMHPEYGTSVHGISFEMSDYWNEGFRHDVVQAEHIDTELLHRAIAGYTVANFCLFKLVYKN